MFMMLHNVEVGPLSALMELWLFYHILRYNIWGSVTNTLSNDKPSIW